VEERTRIRRNDKKGGELAQNENEKVKSSQVKNRLIEVEMGTQLTQPQLSS